MRKKKKALDCFAFSPTTLDDLTARGWYECDFVLVTGDAYVDHPSFANGVLSRVLESVGFKVGVLSQPDWRNPQSICSLGKPRLSFLVSAGNLDSNLNAYTAHKLPRSEDPYSPGGKTGQRPVHATIVYCNLIRKAFGKIPIVIGGIEASQRRFSHYDFWEDRVRRSILIDSNADLLVYGMGERQLVEIAKRLDSNEPLSQINDVRGTAYVRKDIGFLLHQDYVRRFGKPIFTPSNEQLVPAKGGKAIRVQERQFKPNEITQLQRNYATAFKIILNEQDPVQGRPLVEQCKELYVVQLPPPAAQTSDEIDRWYDLPYTRLPHTRYEEAGGVPAWLTTQHSIVTHRGCLASCSFCTIAMHQGRIIQSRSIKSILREAQAITQMSSFRGYVTDVGGPSANMYACMCDAQKVKGACLERDCLLPNPCPALQQNLDHQMAMLASIRKMSGIKGAFISSGIRHDLLIDEKTAGEAGKRYIELLAKHHTSGQLKVAPEHMSPVVLRKMRKPIFKKYETFKELFLQASRLAGKDQYIVPYFMSSHPGCTMADQIRLAQYFKTHQCSVEQVQDFVPTPMTLATTMYYSGLDPETLKPVYSATTMREKRRQRVLLQFNRPEFRSRVRKALVEAGRGDLIGHGSRALVSSERNDRYQERTANKSGRKKSRRRSLQQHTRIRRPKETQK
ncbi:MAG: YgiQ family radical SAM protein [Pseudomonadota bacterium]